MSDETPMGQERQPGWDTWEASTDAPASSREIEWWPPQQASWQEPIEPSQQGSWQAPMGQGQQGWQPPPGASLQEASWQPAQQWSSQPPMEPAQQGSWYYPAGPPPGLPPGYQQG